MKRLFTLVTCAVVSLASWSSADSFSIPKFEGETVGAPDDYIAAEFNDELKKANPNAIQDGRFYVRQKFEDPFDDAATTYGLYQGKITGLGKAKLGKFSLTDTPYSDVLKTKFYLSANSKPDADIDRVYFDGKFVYVEGETPIYVNIDGKMTELRPSIERVSYLNITSQPSGASITIAGESKGTTPSKVSVLGTKSVVVTLSKNGYYTKILIQKPLPGSTVDMGELLTAKSDLENPATALKNKVLEATKKGDAKSIAAVRSTVQDKINSWPRESGAAIQKILSSFPPNPNQRSEESADEYGARTLAWQQDRDAEQNRQQAIADKATNDLQALLSDLDKSAESAQFALKWAYVPATSIELGRFNKSKSLFEVTVKGSGDASYTYKTTFEMGSLSSSEIVARKDQLQGVMKFWAVPASNGKMPVFASASFFIDQTPLIESGKGTYTSADLTPDLSTKGASFDTKLAGLYGSERSNFDAEDSRQTKALLIKFAAPAPVPVPAPVPTPAPAPVVTPPPPAVEESTLPEEETSEATEDEETENESTDVADLTSEPDDTATDEEAREESADEAVENIDDKFGRGDEYRKWGAYALAVSAVGAIVGTVLQHIKVGDSQADVDANKTQIENHKNSIYNNCSSDANVAACVEASTWASRQTGPLSILEPTLKENEDILTSYKQGRLIMGALAVLSISGSVVLFTW